MVRAFMQVFGREGAIHHRRGQCIAMDLDHRHIDLAAGVGALAPHALAVLIEPHGETRGDGHVARVGVQFDLDAVGEVPARLVDHHVPAGHQEEAFAALEEKTARVGQQPIAVERVHPRRGQQQRISGNDWNFFF